MKTIKTSQLSIKDQKDIIVGCTALFEKVLINHVTTSELRDFYRHEWKKHLLQLR